MTRLGSATDPPQRQLKVLVTSTASDSHMWNLVYLQLLIEEMDHSVANLGSCVPDSLLLAECRRQAPELVVVSSVNGHGLNDGLRIGPMLRAEPELARTPFAIGGKLGVDGGRALDWRRQLAEAGFDAVFGDSAEDVVEFQAWLRALAAAGSPAPTWPASLVVAGSGST